MHAFLFIAALIHLLIAFLRFFISIESLAPVDYVPSFCAVIVTIFISLYLIISRRPSGGLRIDYMFLVAFMLLYLISCSSLSKISQLNEFSENKVQLYDTFILFFFFNTLGHYIGRWKNPVIFRLFLNAVVFVCSIITLYVLFNIFRGSPLTTPNGKLICMTPYNVTGKTVYRLELAMNPNGAAQAVSIAVLIGMALFLWNKTIAGKGLAVLMLLIFYACIVLTGSRTSLITTVSGCIMMIFFHIFYGKEHDSNEKTAKALIASLVLFTIAVILHHSIYSRVESVYNLPDSAPTAEGFPGQTQIQADRLITDTPLVFSSQQESAAKTEATSSISSQGNHRHTSKSALIVVAAFRNNMNNLIMPVRFHAVPELLSAAEEQTAPSPLYTKLNFLLSGRLRVWGYAVKAITASPQTIRHGVTPGHIFSAMDQAAGIRIKLNTHNQFLEVALALGIPALIVFILFIIYTTLNSISMFKYARIKPLSVIAPIFFYVFLISNVTEASLMFHRLLPSYIFFFVCGWINERGVLIRKHLRKKQVRANERSTCQSAYF